MSNPDILTHKPTAAPVRFEVGCSYTPILGEHAGKSERAPVPALLLLARAGSSLVLPRDAASAPSPR